MKFITTTFGDEHYGKNKWYTDVNERKLSSLNTNDVHPVNGYLGNWYHPRSLVTPSDNIALNSCRRKVFHCRRQGIVCWDMGVSPLNSMYKVCNTSIE